MVPFDFTDRSGTKWRPAVVVSSDDYNRRTPDVLVASITSNLRAVSHPGDYQIVNWKVLGLLKPSLVQTKLATLEASLVGRKLGALSVSDMPARETGKRAALGMF